MYWTFYVDIPVSMATNKMVAISNKKWLICIIIIPSAVWSEHMPVYNDRAIFHLSKYFYFKRIYFRKPKKFYNNSEFITDATFKLSNT